MMPLYRKISTSPYPSTREKAQSQQTEADESSKPYLLFDAGETLIFPNQSLLIQEAWEHGIEITDKIVFDGYYQLIYTLDYRAHTWGHNIPRNPWPQGYVCALLESIGIDDPVVKVIDLAAQSYYQEKSLWTFTFDWVPKTLGQLREQGYGISVISNSDGRSHKTLRNAGLDHFFDCIFDSAKIGIAKPDPGIFQKALHKSNLEPADALYVGDVFEVDVRGANAAGKGEIHLDPLSLYQDRPGVQLPDIRHLPGWLTRYVDGSSTLDLFPFGCPESSLQCKNRDTTLIDWSHSWHSQEYCTAPAQQGILPQVRWPAQDVEWH